MNHHGFVLPAVFGVLLIFLGTWFLLNLMLAVIIGEYIQGEEEYAMMERQKAMEEKEELEKRISENQRMKSYSRLNTLLANKEKKVMSIQLGLALEKKI